jgi:hypothetical protein
MSITASQQFLTLGLSSTFTPTSTYVSYETMPASGAWSGFDITITTSAQPIDFRVLHSFANDSSQFTFNTTEYLQQTCSFSVSTVKGGHSFVCITM